ncbi:MAG: CPBP family intramembrane metalloprotease [Anaerolineae bacterium]|nr:CPBP family intramembrane metalloprotease [Anaerolineae bacterium]
MSSIKLPTRRGFNWKVFLILAGMLLIGHALIIPFSYTLQADMLHEMSPEVPALQLLIISTVSSYAIALVLGGIGLFLAGRIGLGLPFIEGLVKKEPVRGKIGRVILIAAGIGLASGVLILIIDSLVFSPFMVEFVADAGIESPEAVHPPAWQGLMAAVAAGINEETMFRLFGVTLIAWLGSLIFHDEEGRPPLWLLWTANVLYAVGFGLAHLPSLVAIGLPINLVTIVRTIVLNGLLGVACGWLYWKYGLESAMIAHFSADIVLHVLLVLAITGSIV